MRDAPAALRVIAAPLLSMNTLAAGTDASRSFSEVVPWLILLLGLVLVGGVLIFLARRMLRDQSSSPPEPFTLQGLRDMRAQGLISDEEFERARTAMIDRLTATEAPDADSDHPASEAKKTANSAEPPEEPHNRSGGSEDVGEDDGNR